MANIIRFEDASKTILNNKIFDNLNFEFSDSIYHLIGNNGSGKTTLLKLIMGLEKLSSGRVFLDNQLISSDTASSIYYAPDDLPIYDFLKGIEFLDWITKVRIHPKAEVEDLIKGFKLRDSINKTFAEMSLGTKKKFVLISVLIGQPKFILLDEPFNGLDAAAQEYLMHNLLERASRSGIIFTHHNLKKLDFKADITKVEIANHNLNFVNSMQDVLA